MKNLKITYLDKIYNIQGNTSIIEFLISNHFEIQNLVASIVNGVLKKLNDILVIDSNLSLIDRRSPLGQRIYQNSALMIFRSTTNSMFSNLKMSIEHSVKSGIYIETPNQIISQNTVDHIEKNMNILSNESALINQLIMQKDQARVLFEFKKRPDILELLKFYNRNYLNVYELKGTFETFVLPLVPKTSYIKHFKVQKHRNGLVLLFPQFENGVDISDQVIRPKLAKTYDEYLNWSKVLEIKTTGQLNKVIMDGETKRLIKLTEALHEKKIIEISNSIISNTGNPKLIFCSGPSSSGKTTFAKKLAIQLNVAGVSTDVISLDDYFVNRKDSPIDCNGKYNFETIEAIDYNFFQLQLNEYLNNNKIKTPLYDFNTGKRKLKTKEIIPSLHKVLIIEGLHGLNPILTSEISKIKIFKIYISALTNLNLHLSDRVPSTYIRLLRRIVRDSLNRGHSAEDTLKSWNTVREGEAKFIFPYQETADVIFNTSLSYEISVLKTIAEKELLKVAPESKVSYLANHMLEFLGYFLSIDKNLVPINSILNEFTLQE